MWLRSSVAVRRLPRGIWNLKGVGGGGSEVSGGGKIDNGGQELRRSVPIFVHGARIAKPFAVHCKSATYSSRQHGATVRVLEKCMVAPPPNTIQEKSLPLTFFDLPFLHSPLIHHIFFCDYSHPTSHFTNEVIPKLKTSLSLTLQHYFPLAGNLIIPYNSRKPEIRYANGDSISLAVIESSEDFSLLTSNTARASDDFYPLVPKLPPSVCSSSSGALLAPLLAVQVTLFPTAGICVGFTFQRVPADGNACHKCGSDEELIASGSLPYYDRSVIDDPSELSSILWDQQRNKQFTSSQPEYVPTNKVRDTLVMHQSDVQRLKQIVLEKCPKLSRVSTFTVTCAYVWTCLIKSRRASGEEIKENDLEHFMIGADCRSLIASPLPANYFGNCLVNCIITAKTVELMQESGFIKAAGLIGEVIREKLHNKGGVLNGAEKWLSEIEGLNPERVVGVAGSPKFAVYDMDFGWGKPRKSEVISIDTTGSISLNECRDSKGDLEVGLSLPKVKMEPFSAIFASGIMEAKDQH
nr:malonyl-coenzyme A:anthocyanin 3-O-glucoside-6''-O-malonyltransferase-like [Coffea arabica]